MTSFDYSTSSISIVGMRLLVALIWSMALVLLSGTSLADISRLESIEIRGLEKYSESAALSFLSVNLGDRLDQQSYQDIIRSLFASGYFQDIQLFQADQKLIIEVRERPWIASIAIYGNELVKTEDMLEVLKQQGIETNHSFNEEIFEKITREIESIYYIQGYYGVKVKTVQTELNNGNIELQILIAEGEVSRIANINLVGNNSYQQQDLLRLFTSRSQHPDYLFNSDDKYLSASLEGDLQKLQNFYQNRGYARFRIASRQVALSPNFEGVFINIRVQEGAIYQFAGSRVSGYEKVLLKEKVDELNLIRAGETFSAKVMNDTRNRLKKALENKGYAFSQVELLPVIDDQSKQVFVRINAVAGQRVYVRRIIFVGNNITLDRVIRREFRQYEGALYLPEKLALSEKRLRRVGFFVDVSADSRRVDDQLVDIIVRVNEKRTGSFNAQLGYSEQQGVSYKLALSESNLLGYGYAASISAETNQNVDSAELVFSNPYVTNRGNSLSLNLGYTHTDIEERNYVTDAINLGVSYGVPLSEDLRLGYRLNYQANSLKCNSDFTLCNRFVSENGSDQEFRTLGISLNYDLRNRAFFPSSGSSHFISADAELPDSEFGFYNLSARSNFYSHFDQLQRITLRTKFRGSLVGGLNKDLPFYKNLLLGGQNSVRGFGSSTLGPPFSEDDGITTTVSKGGYLLTQANMDLYLPLERYDQFNPNDDNVRLNLFVDSGYVYPRLDDFNISEWRVSVGSAIIYFTPLGILSVYYAVPIKNEPSDTINNFGFSITNAL